MRLLAVSVFSYNVAHSCLILYPLSGSELCQCAIKKTLSQRPATGTRFGWTLVGTITTPKAQATSDTDYQAYSLYNTSLRLPLRFPTSRGTFVFDGIRSSSPQQRRRMTGFHYDGLFGVRLCAFVVSRPQPQGSGLPIYGARNRFKRHTSSKKSDHYLAARKVRGRPNRCHRCDPKGVVSYLGSRSCEGSDFVSPN